MSRCGSEMSFTHSGRGETVKIKTPSRASEYGGVTGNAAFLGLPLWRCLLEDPLTFIPL